MAENESALPPEAPAPDPPDPGVPGPHDPAIQEPTAPPVAVSPVPAPRRTARWGIAALVVIAVVAVASAAVLFVSAAGSVSRLAGWVPAGTAVYAEVRLDPPGDQGDRVAELLAHFPGFADRSQLDTKVTEALDRALGDASGGKLSYSSMKPWLGDVAAMAARPAAVTGGSGAGVAPPTGTTAAEAAPLVIVATKDPTAARAWLAANVPSEGATTETHGVAQLTTGTSDGMAWAYTVVDDVVLAGAKDAVEAAVDTKGAGAFASSEPFRTAAAAVPGDHLGFVFVDTKAMLSAALASGAASIAGSALDATALDRLPAWTAATLRANGDSLQVDAASPRIAGYQPSGDRASTLAPRLPAGTLAAAEVRDVGKLVLATIEQLKADPKTADAATQIEKALETAGGAQATVGWMGDGAIAVTQVDGKPDAGLVVATTDEAAAQAKLVQLRNLLSLAGAGTSGIKVTDEPYGDGTITTVDLGDLGALAGAAGAGGGLMVPGGDARLAFSVQRGLLVLGADDAFVKAVLDTSAGSSLADGERYKTALQRAGSSNAGQIYVDVGGLLEVATPSLSAEERARFERDVKPFADQLGAFAGASSAGDPMRVRFVVTVK